MKIFADALAVLSDADLAGGYDPDAMNAEDVYLGDVFADEGPEGLEYVLQGLPALRRFSVVCAARGDGAIKILS